MDFYRSDVRSICLIDIVEVNWRGQRCARALVR